MAFLKFLVMAFTIVCCIGSFVLLYLVTKYLFILVTPTKPNKDDNHDNEVRDNK